MICILWLKSNELFCNTGNSVAITRKYFQPADPRSDDKRLAYVLENSPSFGSILLSGVAIRVGDAVTLDVPTILSSNCLTRYSHCVNFV